MLNKFWITAVILGGLTLSVPLAKGQETSNGTQQPVPPIQPATNEENAAAPKPAASGLPITEQEPDVPDSHPLAGAQGLTLGSSAGNRNFLLPSLGVTTQLEVDKYNSSTAIKVQPNSATYLTGGLAVNRTSGGSQFLLDYLGGGTFSNTASPGNSVIQNLEFSEVNHWGRWSVMVGDHVSYTSQSPFGFGGLGGLGNFGVSPGNGEGSSSGFRHGFLPDQSILINGPHQVSNAAIGQTDYALSHRSSLTFVGSYGILNFAESGFQNSTSVGLQGGYNYSLDRVNSIAVFYRFDDLSFPIVSERVKDHTAQFSYARRITGRMNFQVSAGPDILESKSPISGPNRTISWAASASFKQQYRLLAVGLTYDHYLTGGSGILVGAKTDLVAGSLDRTLNRNWHGAISVGYSRNQPLQGTNANASLSSPQAWFGSVRVSRQFVRYGSFFFAYGASKQSALASICSLPACNVASLIQTISVGYNWGLRPIALK